MTSDKLSIFCLLPTLSPYGGVISVVNLLNLLIDRGHSVTLASMSPSRSPLIHPRTEPLLFDGPESAKAVGRNYDILMATSWQTAEPVASLSSHLGVPDVYFVQDFEPDFYVSGDPRSEAARLTYDLIDTRIVKTSYLRERLLAEGGWDSQIIPPGMDLDVFYPRTAPDDRGPSVIAMARPSPPAEHRGFDILRQVFQRLGVERPEVDLVTFGNSGVDFGVQVERHGKLQPEVLPSLYSASAVYLDVSRRHGFGRTGIEAMACGAVPVLTESGGVTEYAVHELNCLLIPVEDVDAAVSAVERVLDDNQLRSKLAANGLQTVKSYSDAIAAEALLALLRRANGFS